MLAILDLNGQRFGMLQVVTKAGYLTRPSGQRYIAWECKCDCGGKILVCGDSLKRGRTSSCGCLRRENARRIGRLNSNPGGKYKDADGYIRVKQREHPLADKTGRIAEHRLVMEASLGRLLLPYETVHHKNGIRNDNRIENLELWSSQHPKGQKIEDLVAWARDILITYTSYKELEIE